jgi:hypothetical protein
MSLCRSSAGRLRARRAGAEVDSEEHGTRLLRRSGPYERADALAIGGFRALHVVVDRPGGEEYLQRGLFSHVTSVKSGASFVSAGARSP